MGKYCLSLIDALKKNSAFKKDYDPILIFSTNLNTSDLLLKDIKTHTNINKSILINLPIDISSDLEAKKGLAKAEMSKSISNLIRPKEQVDFLSLAPFFVGFPSVFPEVDGLKKLTIVYDLIPFLVWQKQRIFPDDIYFDHFKFLYEADGIFSISQAAKNDLVTLLGVDSKRIHNINGGAFEVANESGLKERTIRERYILYPSAPIIHKNNSNAVKAFKIFNESRNNKYKLVFTSSFDEETKSTLRMISKDIIFTGNVTDKELAALYINSDIVLFASLAEGLGMPVLEAVIYGKPIACSDIAVLAEMSDKAFYLFDPSTPVSIAAALNDAVDGLEWDKKKSTYPEIKAKYQWSNSAKDFMQAAKSVKAASISSPKKIIEIISPYPGEYDPEQQLTEYIYGNLYGNFDVVLRYYGSPRAPKVPAFAMGYQAKTQTDTPELSIVIGKSPRSVRPRSTRQIKITLKKTKRFLKNLRTRAVGDIEVKAQPVTVNKALGLKGWEYEMAVGRDNLRAVLIEKIKKEIS